MIEKSNLHLHTYRCNHATGSEREYVEKYISDGFDVIGFSDHAPMPFKNGYVSNIRMSLSQMDDYVDTVLSLRKEYKDDIDIHLGLEAEYYPEVFEDFLAFIEQYPTEYLLLGQHFLGNEYEDMRSSRFTGNVNVLKMYVDQMIEGMSTGKFLYVAHPDLINFDLDEEGNAEIYKAEMARLCKKAKEMNIPLEINLLGFERNRHYPNRCFWEVAANEGNRVTVGIDGHHVKTVLLPKEEKMAMDMADELGIKIIPPRDLI